MRHAPRHLASLILASTLAALSAPSAQAANSINILGSSCSGSESIVMGTDLSFSCTGDYSFIGGSINWDSKVSFLATGSMSFNQFNLTTKNLSFNAGGTFTFADGMLTASENVTIDVGDHSLNGGTITLGTPLQPHSPVVLNLTGDNVDITLGSPGSITLHGGHPMNPPNVPPSGLPPTSGTITLTSQSNNLPNKPPGIVVAGVVTLQSSGGVPPVVLLTGGNSPTVSPVPEPDTYAMLMAGLALVAGAVRRRKAGAVRSA
jgi:hypothetical protein